VATVPLGSAIAREVGQDDHAAEDDDDLASVVREPAPTSSATSSRRLVRGACRDALATAIPSALARVHMCPSGYPGS
jgi:hypothetical protein